MAQGVFLVDVNGNPITATNSQNVSIANVPTVNFQHGNTVDSTNSSTSLLGANAVFTGAGQSSLFYSAISVEVFADQASAANGLSIQQSQDNINWDTKDTFSISAATAFTTMVNLVGQYYRVVYTNGAVAQGTFRLQVIKQAAEVVEPRTLTSLGNQRTAIQEIASGLSVSNPIPVNNTAQQGGVAAYASNAANTTAASDYQFKWGASGTTQVNHVAIQNNTTAAINYAFDVTASAGSFLLSAGQTAVWDVQTLILHLYTAANQNVNGTSSGNIVAQGWL